MELVLVRHALPLRVDATPDGAPADPGLAPRGHEQAQRLVAALAGERVDALVSSPMRRARETLAPLVAARGLQPTVVPDVAEFDVAALGYVPVEELQAMGGPQWERMARGELPDPRLDAAAFRTRVVAALAAVAEAHPGGRVVVLTHSGCINAAAGDVLGIATPLWCAPAYCSVTRVAISRSGKRGVVSLNETAHVRDLL